jgi:hypothetical protein
MGQDAVRNNAPSYLPSSCSNSVPYLFLKTRGSHRFLDFYHVVLNPWILAFVSPFWQALCQICEESQMAAPRPVRYKHQPVVLYP